MHGELFDSTIPFGEPELLRASAFRGYLDGLDGDNPAGGPSSRVSGLSPSLQADLDRSFQDGAGSETLEALAACLRHSKDVTIHLECGAKVVPLTVFPRERLLHCPVDLEDLVARHLTQLQVMHIEPAMLRPPDDPERSLVGEAHLYHALGPLLWELAMRGSRRELLPEIAGPAVYRVSPDLDIRTLPASGALRATIDRLRRQTAHLGEIASWPAFDRERAARLLNALYLQSGLMISRSHPDAFKDSRFSGL